VPYVIFLVLRHFMESAIIFAYVLMINPLFGVFIGLGYISEVCYYSNNIMGF